MRQANTPLVQPIQISSNMLVIVPAGYGWQLQANTRLVSEDGREADEKDNRDDREGEAGEPQGALPTGKTTEALQGSFPDGVTHESIT